jgi:siroheme synthase
MNEFKQIAIVGTGPGHPDYMTKRALDYLNRAEVVLYDCLIDEITLSVVPKNVKCERVEKKFKKSNGLDIFDQEILQRMLAYLKEGKKVVRIKPGDSLNYNSGGMEADYLASKGYEVEIVPGIPTHFAAANNFKLNLTEIAQSNGFITFMADELEKDHDLLPHIACLINHGGIPICLYGMRVETFSVISKSFVESGIPNSMPVAICGDVSLASEELIKTNLGDCTDLVELLASEQKLPVHFVVLIGKYILTDYVEFKHKTK